MASGCFNVYFDGAASPNPGKGGAGVVLDLVGGLAPQEVFRFSGSLAGTVSSNVAEYAALLHALYVVGTVMANNPVFELPVVVRGDSELVIRQMTGEYKVKNRNIKPWYLACRAAAMPLLLANRIVFEHVPREFNTRADSLAAEAARNPINPTVASGELAIYRPNVIAVMRYRLDGADGFASTDIGTPLGDLAPNHMIDASYLMGLRDGEYLFSTSKPCPKRIAAAKVRMNVICSIPRLQVEVIENPSAAHEQDRRNRRGNRRPENSMIVVLENVLVIDSLPVPLHISIQAASGTLARQLIAPPMRYGLVGGGPYQLEAGLFGEPYSRHEYWASNVHFMPF